MCPKSSWYLCIALRPFPYSNRSTVRLQNHAQHQFLSTPLVSSIVSQDVLNSFLGFRIPQSSLSCCRLKSIGCYEYFRNAYHLCETLPVYEVFIILINDLVNLINLLGVNVIGLEFFNYLHQLIHCPSINICSSFYVKDVVKYNDN